MELLGRWERGRPQRRFIEEVKEDMQSVAVLEEDVRDRVRGSAVATSKESSWKKKNVIARKYYVLL